MNGVLLKTTLLLTASGVGGGHRTTAFQALPACAFMLLRSESTSSRPRSTTKVPLVHLTALGETIRFGS